MQHLAVTGIYAHMRDFRCIIGAFKEYQIARLRLFSADRRTDIIDALGGQTAHVADAGCGIHITDESGTVETGGRTGTAHTYGMPIYFSASAKIACALSPEISGTSP